MENDRLNTAFDTSSEKNRNLLFAFLLLQVYLLSAIFSTSDLDLVRAGISYELPIANIQVSLIGFFLFAPALLLIFHINILVNLEGHVNILNEWQKKASNKHLKYPFILNKIAERNSRNHKVTKIRKALPIAIGTLSYVIFPLFVLAAIQFRFSDYHSIAITSLHSLIILIDLYVVNNYLSDLKLDLFNWEVRKLFSFKSLKRTKIYILLLAGVISILNLVATVTVVKYTNIASKLVRFGVIPRITLIDVTIPELKPEYKSSMNPEIWKNYKEHWELFATLDLSNRNFELANFHLSFFYNAKLQNTKFDGAELTYTNFGGSEIISTTFDDAIFGATKFPHTHIQNVLFKNLNMPMSDFGYARIFHSNFTYVNLRESNFVDTWFYDSLLLRSNFSRAIFDGVNFEGLGNDIFFNKQLPALIVDDRRGILSSFMRESLILDSSFRSVNLTSNDLSNSMILTSNFRNVDLSGTTLWSSEVITSDFNEVNFTASEISRAEFIATKLNKIIAPYCLTQHTSIVGIKEDWLTAQNSAASGLFEQCAGKLSITHKKNSSKVLEQIKRKLNNSGTFIYNEKPSDERVKDLLKRLEYVSVEQENGLLPSKILPTIDLDSEDKLADFKAKRRELGCAEKSIAIGIGIQNSAASQTKGVLFDNHLLSHYKNICPEVIPLINQVIDFNSQSSISK